MLCCYAKPRPARRTGRAGARRNLQLSAKFGWNDDVLTCRPTRAQDEVGLGEKKVRPALVIWSSVPSPFLRFGAAAAGLAHRSLSSTWVGSVASVVERTTTAPFLGAAVPWAAYLASHPQAGWSFAIGVPILSLVISLVGLPAWLCMRCQVLHYGRIAIACSSLPQHSLYRREC